METALEMGGMEMLFQESGMCPESWKRTPGRENILAKAKRCLRIFALCTVIHKAGT